MNAIPPLLAQAAPLASDQAAALSGKRFIIELAETVRDLVAQSLHLFSPALVERLEQPLIARITGIDLVTTAAIAALVAVVHLVIGRWLRRHARAAVDAAAPTDWRALLLQAAARPLYLFLWAFGIFFALAPLIVRLGEPGQTHPLTWVLGKVFDLGFFAALFWLFFRLAHVAEMRVKAWTRTTSSTLDDLLAPLLIKTVRVTLPVLALILALPLMGLPIGYAGIISRGSSLLIIGVISWVLCQAVLLMEKVVLARYDVKNSDNLKARAVHTQVQVLRKTLLFLIAIFTVASVLMLFDEVRRLGTSILASAGVLGIIIGFAAQRTISNLFAGLQIALTQPIRLDDVVIVENEWGRIEEIALTYVVVRIWDLRRLVVPIQHFIDRPFQNWTRVSADLLGTVFLYCDYTVPVPAVRAELDRIVKTLPDWDGKAVGLQVTNATERTVELRALASAADAPRAWNLRCAIREQLLAFLQEKHPGCLPKSRVELEAVPQKAKGRETPAAQA